METLQQKQNKVFDLLKGDFGYKGKLAAPRIEKIVISSGTGKKSRTDKDFQNLVAHRIESIVGQKPGRRAAKKSVAGFKVREGESVGVVVTLRGERMQSFFDKLIDIALPRTRDFRGISRTAVDEMGNLTIGIKEHTIFPATADEDLRNVFGMAITIVTTATSREEGLKFFEALGVPLQKAK